MYMSMHPSMVFTQMLQCLTVLYLRIEPIFAEVRCGKPPSIDGAVYTYSGPGYLDIALYACTKYYYRQVNLSST